MRIRSACIRSGHGVGILRARDAAMKLSPRETQVIELLKCGLSNKEIAHKLNLAEGTVRIYLIHIYRKLHVNNRVAAVMAVLQGDLSKLLKAPAG